MSIPIDGEMSMSLKLVNGENAEKYAEMSGIVDVDGTDEVGSVI